MLKPLQVMIALLLALAGAGSARAASSSFATYAFVDVARTGVSGTARVTSGGAETNILITMSGMAGNQPAALIAGSCAAPGAVASALNDVDSGGYSGTSVALSSSKLRSGSYAVAVYAPLPASSMVACADIGRRAAPVPQLAIRLSINRSAQFDVATGQLTVSGTLTCSEDATVDVSVSVVESTASKSLFGGATAPGLVCTAADGASWSLTVAALNGTFLPGRAAVDADANGCGRYTCDQDDASVKVNMR
jgi:hypothetical protein